MKLEAEVGIWLGLAIVFETGYGSRWSFYLIFPFFSLRIGFGEDIARKYTKSSYNNRFYREVEPRKRKR